MGRILAVDLGTKRVGFALSDPLKIISTPYTMIPFTTENNLINEIRKLVKEKEIETVVIGLPIRENGNEGTACEKARIISERIAAYKISVILWDERYSSKIAEKILREYGIKHKNSKSKIDSLSASILLESYLQSLNRCH